MVFGFGFWMWIRGDAEMHVSVLTRLWIIIAWTGSNYIDSYPPTMAEFTPNKYSNPAVRIYSTTNCPPNIIAGSSMLWCS